MSLDELIKYNKLVYGVEPKISVPTLENGLRLNVADINLQNKIIYSGKQSLLCVFQDSTHKYYGLYFQDSINLFHALYYELGLSSNDGTQTFDISVIDAANLFVNDQHGSFLSNTIPNVFKNLFLKSQDNKVFADYYFTRYKENGGFPVVDINAWQTNSSFFILDYDLQVKIW